MTNFKTAFEGSFLLDYHKGVINSTWKGVPCLKSPIDLAIYSDLIWRIKPSLIIELGSLSGGSAIWMDDLVKSYGINAQIHSYDLDPPRLEVPSSVHYKKGNVRELGQTDIRELCADFGPENRILVIEDSSHFYEDVLSVLHYFSGILKTDDYIVVEDGILSELGWGNDCCNGGPNRAIEEFLEKNKNTFEIDRGCCDKYGKNCTYSPNGYLRKL